MQQLQTGEFFGSTNQTKIVNGLTLTDTEYTHANVDWHYHENAYFTFLLDGKVIEGNRRQTYQCEPGALLFHNWQEPHYNIKPSGFTRGFHIELDANWKTDREIGLDTIEGSFSVDDPSVKLLMHSIFAETKLDDANSGFAIQDMMFRLLGYMKKQQNISVKNKPDWVNGAREMLHDLHSDNCSLAALSSALHIHPAHLSRDFPRYFNCGLSQYAMKIKLSKAAISLAKSNESLSGIAIDAGFSDQSHFIKRFKQQTGMTPLAFKKLARR